MRRKIIFTVFAILFLFVCSFYAYLYFNYYPPILMYHSFDRAKVGKYAAIDPDVFHRQIAFIKNHNYHVISLKQLCKMLHEKMRIPHNVVVITIDDGYADNMAAVKILKEFDYPATIFVIASDISKKGYLTQTDIEWFLKNTKVRIGSHTIHEKYLPGLPPKELKREIKGSKKVLEDAFGIEINAIAYHTGGFNKQILKLVKEAGYRCACTTNRGFSRKLDIYALRRIKITNKDLGIRLWAKLSGFYNVFRRIKKPY